MAKCPNCEKSFEPELGSSSVLCTTCLFAPAGTEDAHDALACGACHQPNPDRYARCVWCGWVFHEIRKERVLTLIFGFLGIAAVIIVLVLVVGNALGIGNAALDSSAASLVIFGPLAGLMYLLPTGVVLEHKWEGRWRSRPVWPFALLNLLLGWTVIAWVVLIIASYVVRDPLLSETQEGTLIAP